MRRLYFLILLAACSKNEHPVQEVPFTTLLVNTLSVDAVRLKVMINDDVWTDSLVAPNGTKTQLGVHYLQAQNRFRLYDAFSNYLYLDTLVEYHPGATNVITFQQSLTGGNFEWIGPPVNEPVPPAGFTKISFRYTLPSLGDKVKLVLENIVNATSYTPVDSTELRRNEYSKYFLLLYGINTRSRLNFYNPNTRQLLASMTSGELLSLQTGFNTYLIRKDYNPGSGQPLQLYPEKLY